MKRITSLMLALTVLVSFPACKKDKDDKASLTGEWTFVKEDWVQISQGNKTTGTYNYTDADVLTVYENETFTMATDGDFVTGSWKRNGDKITLTAVVDNDVEINELDIKTLTSSSLVLYYKETDTDYSYESTTHLKR